MSSYITAHTQICANAASHTPKHTLCVIAPPGHRPHYRDRFQSCPILASVGPQTKALAWGYTHKTVELKKRQDCRVKMGRQIWDLWVWTGRARSVTDLACDGKMELLSISHIYPHLHTERDWGGGCCTRRRTFICDKTSSPERRDRHACLSRRTSTMLRSQRRNTEQCARTRSQDVSLALRKWSLGICEKHWSTLPHVIAAWIMISDLTQWNIIYALCCSCRWVIGSYPTFDRLQHVTPPFSSCFVANKTVKRPKNVLILAEVKWNWTIKRCQ